MEFFFGEHHLDVDRRELRRGAELIAVEPQVFDLLVYLVRNRDRVICKDELIATVWRGRIVSESTLTSHIHAVRKAVGDSGAAQRLIRTLPRKGIRFVCALKEERARSLAAPPTGVVDPPTQLPTTTRGGVIVSKGKLTARQWPGGVVEEANIYVYATALPDDRQEGPSSVVTVPGRGSRLTGRASAGLEEPSTVQVPLLPAKSAIMVDRDEPQDRPPIVERRQLTVISGELVGLAQLATRLDLEELSAVTAAFSHCCSETIARFGGTVAQLAGDEMLAYFGYPQAQEHDAEQAVRAGLALVGELRRVEAAAEMPRLRLGIATGPVVIGDLIGGNGSDEHGLLGDAVNLAAGLRRIPTPNPIVIAASTRRLVGDLFATRDIPDLQIHGLAGTGEAYEVLGPGMVDSRFEALHGSSLTPLVGREEEIELLLRRWQRIKTGEIRVVLVTGEAGIGKSRLCVELQKRIGMEPHTFLRYFCSPHHQDSALYPVMRQLESAAGFERNDTVEQKKAKIGTLFAQVSVSTGEVDLIAELLSLSPFTGAPPAEFPPRRRRRLALPLIPLSQVSQYVV